MRADELPANRLCPIARSMTVLGQKWTLLLLREAFYGRTRFAEFSRIGIPSDVLADRLERLVNAGLLQRQPYREGRGRQREEYHLTPAGRDVLPVLAALSAWGNAHLPIREGSGVVYAREPDGEELELHFVDRAGHVVADSEVAMRRGPAYHEFVSGQ